MAVLVEVQSGHVGFRGGRVAVIGGGVVHAGDGGGDARLIWKEGLRDATPNGNGAPQEKLVAPEVFCFLFAKLLPLVVK